MKLGLLSLLIAVLIGLSTRAEAGRRYYLVGLRHIYKFELFPDPRVSARQQIEEDYAGAVQQAQDQFGKDMSSIRGEEAQDNGQIHQNDRDAVQQNLEQDLATAADARDTQLSKIYVQCDYVWDQHPELKVDQDGPYRVMSVETNPSGIYVNVIFYQPYPSYVGPCWYGWAWGRPYAYSSFGVVVVSYHRSWIAMGSPVFFGLSFGGSPVEVYAPIRREVIISRSNWVGGRPPMITARDRQVLSQQRRIQIQRGVIHPSTGRGGSSIGRIGGGTRTGNFGTRSTNSGSGGSTGSRYSNRNRTSGSNGGGSGTTGGTRRGAGGTGTSTGGSRYGRDRGTSSGTTGSSTTGTRGFGGSRGTSSTGTSTGGSRFGGSSRGTGSSDSGSSTGSRYGGGTRGTGSTDTGSRSRSGSSDSSSRTRGSDSSRSSGGSSKYSHSDKDKKGG